MIKIKKYQIEDYISDATQDALDLKADLVNGKVPASQLPAYVDDVIEVTSYAALPIPGATGVIYITLDTNKVYRWTGSVYVEIASGVTNLSYTPGVSNGTVNSDTGSDATIPLAGTVNAGLFSAAEKSKLDSLKLQNLQEVTDIGATTTNPITVTVVNDDAITGNSQSGVAVQGSSPEGNGIFGTSINGDGAGGYSETGNAGAFYGIDKGIKVTAGNTFVAELNQGLTSKGLVINSGASSTGNFIELDKNGVDKLTINQAGELTAQKLIKDGGFDFQFLKADGSVDNNTYLTSADLPSTLDLYATTSPDPVISGYTALVRNVTDTRYNTVAVDVPTPLVNGTIASPTFCGAVISDPSVLLGNPGVFNFTVIGNIRRVSGSTSSGADFFFSIYKRDLAGTETFIADSAKVPVPANGGFYVEYISTALWNDGIFLSTDRIVLKFYGIQTGGGTGAYYEFLFGGGDPVRGTAAISSAIIPNIYLRDLADVEKTPALNNEILYWNDSASLWEHSLAENLVPLATATQKGLVSTTDQTFAGNKTFTGAIGIITNSADYGIQVNSDDIGIEVNALGIGIDVESAFQQAGIFNVLSTNTSNIAEFKKDNVLKAAVQNDGKITATAGTAGTDVVVKSQLDTKQNTITLSAIGSSPNANAATLTGSVLNLQPASASFGGVVTTGDQTFAGQKTFSSISFGATGLPTFFEYFGTPFFTVGTGVTFSIGGGPGTAQNNLAVPNGTFNIGLQTASTIASFDASKNVVSLPLATYPSLTELALLKGVSGSSVQTQLNGKQATLSLTTTGTSGAATLVGSTLNIPQYSGGSSAQSAFTILANNTASSAVPTERVYKDIAQQSYTGTIIFSFGTSAPSGVTNNTYTWKQEGKLVTIRLNLFYATAGSGVTAVACELPSDCPVPELPTGVTTASQVLSYGSCQMSINKLVSTAARSSALRLKSTSPNVFEIAITSAAVGNFASFYTTIQYFTA